jgi:hypothetical protein
MGKNIKVDFQEGGWGINWIELAQDRDRWGTCKRGHELRGFTKSEVFLD